MAPGQDGDRELRDRKHDILAFLEELSQAVKQLCAPPQRQDS